MPKGSVCVETLIGRYVEHNNQFSPSGKITTNLVVYRYLNIKDAIVLIYIITSKVIWMAH